MRGFDDTGRVVHRLFEYSESVILAGNFALAAEQVFHRMIQPSVPVVQFVSGQSCSQREQLLAETDAKKGFPVGEHLFHQINGIAHRGRVAGAVRKEITIRVPSFYFGKIGLGGKYFQVAIALVEAAQDILFHPKIHDSDAVLRVFFPDKIRCAGGDVTRKFQPRHAGRGGEPVFQFFQIVRFRRNDAVHGAAFADVLHERPRVHVVDGYHAFRLKIILNAPVSILAAVRHVEIAAHEACDFYAIALNFLIFNAVVADVDISGDQYLPGVRRVGKNFLISGHTCVEADFAGGGAGFSGGFAREDTAVFEEESGFCHSERGERSKKGEEDEKLSTACILLLPTIFGRQRSGKAATIGGVLPN